jgi:hypothetical protein
MTKLADAKNESLFRLKVACAECKRVNDCDCLSQLRLIDLIAPLVRRVLGHLATDGSVIDDEVCEQLALLADRNDQRERENEAQWSNDDEADRDLIEDVVGSWGYEPTFRRDVEGIAQSRKVPVEHVRALVDRFLRESQPEPANALMEVVEIFGRAFDQATSRRAA